MMRILKRVLACILFLAVGFWIGQYIYVPDLMVDADAKERIFIDDRGEKIKIPDYPTAVIPSDLRISPIIETFGRESTARDKGKTIMITLPKDVEFINEKTAKHYPMVVMDMSSPSNVLKAYAKLGDIFHRADIAMSVTNGCGDAISNAINRISDQERKKVLYLKAPYKIPKMDTIEDNILAQSHVISIWHSKVISSKENEYGSYTDITMKEIEAFAPDVIICKTNDGKRTIIHDMPELAAVKNEKVFSIEDTDYHFEFDEYHSIPAVIWVIKKVYDLDTPDPNNFFRWYLSATKSNYKF